ncbi:MAG: ECF transporter S component [Thermoplasmata archaeon]|nr:ECF transporter S component [Thermoplasmata archaeon]
MSERNPMTPKAVAIYGVMIALVATMTLVLVPIPATRGYFNLGEAMIFFAAFVFGRKVAGVAGAVGAGIIDLIFAPHFLPATIVIKFLEGYVAGTIAIGMRQVSNVWAVRTVACSLAGMIMIAGYFAYEVFVLPLGLSDTGGLGPALVELPFNIFQVLLGGLIAILLAEGIELSYPRIQDFRV